MKPPITLEELIDLGEKHVNRILLEQREKEMYPLWQKLDVGGDVTSTRSFIRSCIK